jgi:YVTN family beta-propeller protein
LNEQKSITMPGYAYSSYLLQNGGKLYLSTPNSSIMALNTKTDQIAKIIQMPYPQDEIVSQLVTPPNSTYAYAIPYGAFNYSAILVINTKSDSLLKTISTPSPPMLLSPTPNGKEIYAAFFYNTSMIVINTTTNIESNYIIQLEAYPNGVEITPDGSKVFVALSDNAIAVIDTKTNSIINTIRLGNYSDSLSMTPDGKQLYVVDNQNGLITIINTSTQSVLKTLTVGHSSLNLEPTPDSKQVYVISFDGNVSSINTTSNNLRGVDGILVQEPFIFLPAPNGKEIYFLSNTDTPNSTMFFLNTSTNHIDKIISNLSDLNSLAINGSIGRID